MQETYRMRILKLINSEDRVFSGKEIARICDLSYKQTIDALDGLHNYGMVQRIGRKYRAKWCRIKQPEIPALDLIMLRLANKGRIA